MTADTVQATDEFMRALKRAKLQTVLSKLQMERAELLSFYDIKELIKPKRQTYRGTMPIKIADIIGSEDRYNDFTNAFLPRKGMLRSRWVNINKAHQEMVNLPSINVFKLGNAYFVRDGNHRVSVAKALGVEFIDAEVVELDSEIELHPGMTDRQIRDKVLEYERRRILKKTAIGSALDMDRIYFTELGRYTEMLHHINVHKYYLNMNQKEEIPFETAAKSWYKHVYSPIAEAVTRQKLLSRFPGRTTGDLYMWIVKHWNRLKDDTGEDVLPETASRDFARLHRLTRRHWVRDWLAKRLFRTGKRD